MSVPRRFNRPQGLKDIDVLIEDDAPVSIYFNIAEVPEVITQGKSSFLIGGSNLLKPEVEIKFEITNDDTGAVIYTEPVPNYLEGTSRRVSIEVYDDVDLFGDATLTVVGELNPLNTTVPTEFLDTYNVRYTRKIYISSAGVNTQPILFFNQPRIVVNEIVKPYITTTIPTGSISKTGGATGEPIPEDIGTTTNVQEIEEPSKFIKKQKNTLNNKMFGGGGNNAFVNKGRRRARRASPDVDKFTITNKSGDKFDARFVGGEIKIPNPQVDTDKFTLESYHQVPSEYKSDVENVKNQDTLIPEKPFTIIDTRFPEDDPQRNVIVPLAPENLTYTASFQPVPTQSISTVNFRSYADIRLSKLRTFSGDVDRIKVYARNKDAFGDFEVISDQQIESPELLFDIFGAGNQRVGYFLNQAHVNKYWVSSSNAVITQDSTYLLNSVEVSGSNKGYNSFVTFEQTGSLPITFNKDTEYNITFNALGFVGTKNRIDNSTEQIGRAAIFFSGSGFRVNHDFGNDLGFQLEVNDQPAFLNVTAGQSQQDFGTLTEIFKPQKDGSGVFKFVVFGGRFFISDVSINPATSTGFSPNFVQIIAPVPPMTQERPDDYEFIAEFYDVNNNVAESIVFASASTFVGGNSYIAGGDNLLSGSMFIGSSIGGGIEMAGVNSGFIRSIGYEGFTSASVAGKGGQPGFLMFSGSVLPDSGDNYSGVGLELVGGPNSFFKFHTEPSLLDIRTDKFFIGQESLQFISGSDSNIEISSSLFHLDPKNERLIIGADATINADLTVNALRTPAQIGGAPSTILNASSSITSQGFARFVSASIGGFHVSDSHISSSGLVLKSDGQMTGSSTLLGNKSAGQFLQFKDSTLTVQGNITADNIRTPATIGGAPSTDLNASSSIDSQGFATFKSASIGGFTISTTEISSSGLILKSSGQLTGSAVSMSGTITADAGRIAGWRIEGSKLSGSNATLDADGAALFKSDQGPGSDTTAAFDQLRNEYYIDFTPADQGNTTNYFVKFGPNFSVNSSGVLFASGAQFEGTISASKGIIGGFTTDGDSLSSNNIFISGSPLAGGVDDPKYMFISTSNFNVKENGDVTGSQVLFDGGKIGGFTLSEGGFSLGTNNINLDSTNKKITINNPTFGNQGIQLDFNSGTPRFYVGDGSNEFLKFDGSSVDLRTKRAFISGSQITLKSPDFFLGDTNNFISGSGGQLKIQALGTTTISGSAVNIATPKFFLGDNTNFISGSDGQLAIQALGTTTISGSAVNIQTPKFFMGGVNQFVSGSNGNIEISSSNFHLQPDGDVIMSGTITAAAGTIGGFAITDTAISSSNDKLILRGDSGQITGSDVLFTAGKIAAWNISGNNISSEGGGIRLNGNGDNAEISVNSHTFGNAGVQLGFNGGSPRFYVGDGSQNFMKFTTGNGVDIKTLKFELDTSALELSSTHASMSLGTSGEVLIRGNSNSPFISLQPAAALADKTYANTGIFFGVAGGSTPLFSLVGSGGHVKFNGTSLDIDSDTFNLNASTLAISSVSSGSIALGASPPTTFESGSGFFVDGAGNLLLGSTAGDFLQFGASTGNLIIKSQVFSLFTSTIVIDSSVNNGKISLGSTPNTSVAGTNKGVYMDGTGDFLVRGNASNFLKFDAGGNTLEIKSDTFDLDAGTIIIDSAGSGVMKLGASASSITETANTGVFIDGAGKFRVGGPTSGDNFIHFNGSQIILKSPDFFLGDATNFISGSSGNMSIQSGNFELDANNIEISSAQASMSLGEGKIILKGSATSTIKVADKFLISSDGTDEFLAIGDKTSFTHFDQSTTGMIMGMDDTTPKFEIAKNAANYLSFDGSNFDIKLSQGLELDATNIELSSTHASMSLGEGKIKLVGGSTSTITIGSSNALTLSDDGTDRFLVIGSKTSFSHFNQSTAGFIVGTDNGTTKFELVGNATNYLSFDGTNFDVKLSQGLELDASNIEISSTHASMSLGSANDINLDGVNKKITIGSANAVTIQGGSTDNFMVMGSKTSFTHFNQSTAGIILGMDSTVPKFEIVGNASNYLSFDGTNFDVKLSQGLELDASNIELSSTHASMSIGNTNPIILQSTGNDRVLRFGSKTDFGQTTTAGFIMGIDNGVPKLDFTVGTNNDNFFRIDSSGVDFSSDNLTINTDRFKITTTAGNERIRFFSGSNADAGRITGAGEFVRIGEISDDASDLYGLKIYDGTGTGSADTLVKLGQDGNQIAGWTITQDRFSGGQMIIRSDGTIESAGFASDVAGSGFRLSAENGGFLEVENAKIRGTMATAVFEKESVNAVGGQLYVANSTTLTGSSFPTTLAAGGRTAGDYPANESTMSVENVTGFVQGEILSLKKVTDTGFSTEYVFINSASRQNPSSETDFSGQLYVTRGYGSGISGDSGSLGDQPSSAQSYSGSQVIVSTGRYISGNAPNTVGSGYIRMNANPADPATPYIDIIERTGSGIYDVELKARLGDLSGLSSGLLFGETNPGFGLFTENVFLKGAITAVTGSITGKLFIDTSSSQKMIFGIGVDGGSNDGIFINANNYWYTTGAFKVGSATYNLQNDASGNISINPKTFELDATNIEVSSTHASMSLGEGKIKLVGASTSTITVGDTNSIKLSDDGTDRLLVIGSKTNFDDFDQSTAGVIFGTDNGTTKFEVVGNSSNYISFNGSAFDIKSQTFDLNASTLTISSNSTGSIALGASPPTTFQSGTGFFVDGAGNFLLGSTSGNFVQFAAGSGNLTIKSQVFSLFTSTIVIDSSVNNGKIALGASPNTSVGGTNKGIYMDGTGDFLVRGDASNFLKFDAGGNTLEIKSDTFDLDAGTLILDSGTNSGKIALGATPPTAFNSGTGFYADGTGKFLAGAHNGNRIQFDGTNIDIIADTFFIGTTNTQFISGSDSNIEISSSLFHLDPKNSTLVIGADAVINADLTANSIRTPATIAGSQSTNQNASSSIDSQGFAAFRSASIGGWDIDPTTIASTDDKVIIDSSNKRITINNTSFGSTGIQLEFNGGTPRFFAGSTSKFIKFDGSDIDLKTEKAFISGSQITLKSPDFFLGDSNNFVSGSGGQLAIQATGTTTISGSAVNIQTPKFFMGGQNQFISGSVGNIEISSSNFHLERTGDVTMAGTVTATAGEIGGFGISSNSISSSNGNLKLFSSGQITGSQVLFEGGKVGGWTITANQLEANNIKINAAVGYIEAGDLSNVNDIGDTSTGFFVNKDGEILLKAGTTANKNYMQFKNGTLDINTDKAFISGSEITLKSPDFFLGDVTNFISGSGGNLSIQSSGNTTLSGSSVNILTPNFLFGSPTSNISGSSTGLAITTNNFSLTGTNLELSNSKFNMGTLSSATDIADTSTGFHVDSSGNVLIKQGGANAEYLKFAGGGLDIKAGTFDLATNKLIIDSGTNNGKIAIGSTPPTAHDSGTGFYVDGNGKFLVGAHNGNRVQFDGTNIDIIAETFFIGTTSTQFISGSDSNIEISSSLFHLDPKNNSLIIGADATIEADLTANNIRTPATIAGSQSTTANASASIDSSGNAIFRSGSVGGWTMNSTTLTGGVVTLNSAGSIEVGSLADATTTATTNSGFFADSSGNVLIKGNTNDNDYVKISGGGGIDIRSQTFDLDAGSLIMDSAGDSGNGVIRLGGSGGPSTPTADVQGIYMDGGGALNVYGNATNFFRIDGGSFTIKSDTFDLDAGTIVVDSGTNSGKIALGSTPPTAHNSGNGVYIDGTGKALIGSSTGSRIQFDGTNLTMSSSTFLLGSSGSDGSFVSGSNGNLEISSSKFHLKPDGDIVVKKVSADDGEIAGWRINEKYFIADTQTIAMFGSGSRAGSIHVGWKGGMPEILGGPPYSYQSVLSSGFASSGEGIVLSGSGLFRAGSPQGERIEYVPASATGQIQGGGNLILSASSFLLGTSGSAPHTGAFVSGSGGFLVISSSNFFLNRSGDVTMTGDITATGGQIGGFSIRDDGTDRFLVVGSKTTFSHFDQSTQGIILGTDNGTSKFEIVGDANNYLSFNGSGLDVKAQTFDLATSTMILDSGTNNGKIALGATPPSAYTTGTGIYMDGQGRFKFGSSEPGGKNINYDGTTLLVSSSIHLTGSMTVGNAGSASAQPDSFIAVGKPSSPHNTTEGFEIRKDYFATYKITGGEIHGCNTGTSTQCDGLDSSCGLTDHGTNLRAIIGAKHGMSYKQHILDNVDAQFKGDTTFEVAEDATILFTRLVTVAASTSTGLADGAFESQNTTYGSSYGGHVGLIGNATAGESGYIAIGKGMMTEIAYVTAQVPSYVHNTSLGGVRGYHKMHGAIINTSNSSGQHDGFKRSIDNKVIFFTSLNNAMSGVASNAIFVSGSGHFQTGTGDDRYPAGIACFGYNVTTVIRDVFNRGIKYSNLLSEPKNNPEDYVARADHSAGSEGEHTTQGWNSGGFAYSYCYMPYPFAQPHGKAGSLSIEQLNDRWADSGRKIVSFTTTPVVRPMVLMGKGGKIMAVDKDEPGALAGVGYKIYSEFQTEREGGVAGYESIPSSFV